MNKITIDNNYYGFKLYSKKTITLKQGLTVLVGCNGIGKTTLIYQIKDYLQNKDIPVILFDNLKNGGSSSVSEAIYHNNIAFASTAFSSSEGETIILNMGNFASKIGNFVRKNKNDGKKEIYILADAIDSGLSVDNVVEIKKYLFDTIIEDCKKNDMELYLIVSSNEYELARNENCLDVYNCKYINFENYEQYREFIINTSEIKKKRKE